MRATLVVKGLRVWFIFHLEATMVEIDMIFCEIPESNRKKFLICVDAYVLQDI